MKEGFSSQLWRKAASASTLFNRPLFKRLAREVHPKGEPHPSVLAEHMLKKMGIQHAYVQEENENPFLSEWRERLRTEPGIIICDHPLRVEVLALLSMIKRDDVKAVASHLTVEMAAPVFGKDYFIEVDPGTGKNELRKALSKAKDHIRSGGLLILFPTGSSQRAPSSRFRGGFRSILGDMAPDAMVYVCKTDATDIAHIRKGLLFRMMRLLAPGGAASEKSRVRLRLDERYTKALEWQGAAGTLEGVAADRALTSHYDSLFS